MLGLLNFSLVRQVLTVPNDHGSYSELDSTRTETDLHTDTSLKPVQCSGSESSLNHSLQLENGPQGTDFYRGLGCDRVLRIVHISFSSPDEPPLIIRSITWILNSRKQRRRREKKSLFLFLRPESNWTIIQALLLLLIMPAPKPPGITFGWS